MKIWGVMIFLTEASFSGNTFLSNQIDAFFGAQIGRCNGFSAPNSDVSAVSVTHSNNDDIELV